MTFTGIIVILVLVVIIIVAAIVLKRRRPATIKVEHFTERWQELQKNCVDRKTWPLAIIEADNLLDDALKKRRYKGKTTGERLVAAQRIMTSNEKVWFGHKLRNKVVHQDVRKLKKRDVLQALSGFRQALRDLGALKND